MNIKNTLQLLRLGIIFRVQPNRSIVYKQLMISLLPFKSTQCQFFLISRFNFLVALSGLMCSLSFFKLDLGCCCFLILLGNRVLDAPRAISMEIYEKPTLAMHVYKSGEPRVLLFNFALFCAHGASTELLPAQGGIRWTSI